MTYEVFEGLMLKCQLQNRVKEGIFLIIISFWIHELLMKNV